MSFKFSIILILIIFAGCQKNNPQNKIKNTPNRTKIKLNPEKDWESLIMESGLLFKQKKYNEALEIGLKALELAKNTHKGEHLNIVRSMNNVAILKKHLKKYDESEKLYLESIEMLKKLLGKDNSQISIYYSNLGELYRVQKKYKEAVDSLNKAIILTEKSNFPIMKAREHLNISRVYLEMDDYSKSENHATESLRFISSKFPPYHPKVKTVIQHLKNIYEKSGEVEKVKEIDVKLKEMQKILKESNDKGCPHHDHKHNDEHKHDHNCKHD